MITSHHVVRALGIGTGMPIPALAWRLRLLKRAGLLPKDKPGKHGHAPLTSRHVALCLLAAMAPAPSDVPAVVAICEAITLAGLSEFDLGPGGGRCEQLRGHAPEVFRVGSAVDVLEQLLTDQQGAAVKSLALMPGDVPHLAIEMPLAAEGGGFIVVAAEYAPMSEESKLRCIALAGGDRRQLRVRLGLPTFPLLRALVAAEAAGEDLDQILDAEAKRWEVLTGASVHEVQIGREAG